MYTCFFLLHYVDNVVLTVYKGTDFPALMFPLAGVFLTR